jgi:hypothetical protein
MLKLAAKYESVGLFGDVARARFDLKTDQLSGWIAVHIFDMSVDAHVGDKLLTKYPSEVIEHNTLNGVYPLLLGRIESGLLFLHYV